MIPIRHGESWTTVLIIIHVDLKIIIIMLIVTLGENF